MRLKTEEFQSLFTDGLNGLAGETHVLDTHWPCLV